MGYILPVNHYQYQDYQTRVVNQHQQSFAVDKIFKASLDTKRPGRQQREEDRLVYQKNSPFITTPGFHAAEAEDHKPASPAHQNIGVKTYAAVTGKGSYFSETV